MLKFWTPQKPAAIVVEQGGLRVGQVVHHKVDGVRAVIVSFASDDYDGPQAYCALSSRVGDYLLFYLAEIEETK